MKNSQKNIVLISPFFYPEKISTGKYNTALATALVDAGCHVTILCSHPIYPDWVVSETNASLDGVNVIRAGVKIKYPRSAIARRLVLEFWYTGFVINQMIRMRNDVDVTVPIFPPMLFMIILKHLLPKRVKSVGIVHDLLGVMVKSHKSKIRDMVSKIIKVAEKSAFNGCDKIVCLSKTMRITINEKYGISNEKLVVKYPFVSIATDIGCSSLEQIFPADFKHVVYSGALGEKQIPYVLLGLFAEICTSKRDVMCHIFSGGPKFQELIEKGKAISQDRILFHALVDENDVPELYKRSTVQIIPQATGTGDGAFPSKLPNLLAAGVPVFALCDENSELAKVLEQVNFGSVISSWDKTVWVDEFSQFLNEVSKNSHEERKIAIADLIDEKFTVQALVKTIMS